MSSKILLACGWVLLVSGCVHKYNNLRDDFFSTSKKNGQPDVIKANNDNSLQKIEITRAKFDLDEVIRSIVLFYKDASRWPDDLLDLYTLFENRSKTYHISMIVKALRSRRLMIQLLCL